MHLFLLDWRDVRQNVVSLCRLRSQTLHTESSCSHSTVVKGRRVGYPGASSLANRWTEVHKHQATHAGSPSIPCLRSSLWTEPAVSFPLEIQAWSLPTPILTSRPRPKTALNYNIFLVPSCFVIPGVKAKSHGVGLAPQINKDKQPNNSK